MLKINNSNRYKIICSW